MTWLGMMAVKSAGLVLCAAVHASLSVGTVEALKNKGGVREPESIQAPVAEGANSKAGVPDRNTKYKGRR